MKSPLQKEWKTLLVRCGGDLEACTALSHVWAQCGSDDTDAFRQVSKDQVYALFKIAVTPQSAAAVLNLGVVWRYCVSFIIADMTVAIDPILMALQGQGLRKLA